MSTARLLAVALLATSSFAQQVGKIEHTAGDVKFVRKSGETPVKAGDAVAVNDIIYSGRNGLVAVVLTDNSRIVATKDTEFRVVQHDPAVQQTHIEMPFGRIRAEVTPVTKAGGRFMIRTPTALAMALGTVVVAEAGHIDTSSTTPVTSLTQQDVNQLPSAGRDYQKLLDLVPGAASDSGQAGISEYPGVEQSSFTALDHFVGVTNVDPRVKGLVYGLPFEPVQTPKGGSPMMEASSGTVDEMQRWVQELDRQRLFDDFDTFGKPCHGSAMLNGKPLGSAATQGMSYEVSGTGTSTGGALDLSITSSNPCPTFFAMPAGTVLQPTGFKGSVAGGLLLGTPIHGFQIMITMGGMVIVRPVFLGFAPPGKGDTAPEPAKASATLRSYCLELHKLAPHPNTHYKFADPDEQAKLGPNRKIIDTAFTLIQAHKLTIPPMQTMDSIIQWSLWASREGMDEGKFHEEYMRLVKKNYEAQKKKWDKDAERMLDESGRNLWQAVSAVLTATKG